MTLFVRILLLLAIGKVGRFNCLYSHQPYELDTPFHALRRVTENTDIAQKDAFWDQTYANPDTHISSINAIVLAMPKAKPSIDPEDMTVVERMRKEFDRQTVEFADLFEAFAKEDPSVLDDDKE